MKQNKYKVTSFERVDRGSLSPIAKILVNEAITDRFFNYQGIEYIVGNKPQFTGRLFEVELMAIKGVKVMHIHEYYNGICHLCGMDKEEMPK